MCVRKLHTKSVVVAKERRKKEEKPYVTPLNRLFGKVVHDIKAQRP